MKPTLYEELMFIKFLKNMIRENKVSSLIFTVVDDEPIAYQKGWKAHDVSIIDNKGIRHDYRQPRFGGHDAPLKRVHRLNNGRRRKSP